jgi:hypothetical protein
MSSSVEFRFWLKDQARQGTVRALIRRSFLQASVTTAADNDRLAPRPRIPQEFDARVKRIRIEVSNAAGEGIPG